MVNKNVLRAFIREALSLPRSSSIYDIMSGWSDYLHDPREDAYVGSADEEPESSNSAVMGPKLQRGSVTALIIGDSQAGGPLGAALQKELERLGVTVTRRYENGASGRKVVGQMPPASEMPNIVVAIFGGNDTSASDAVSAGNEMLEKASAGGAMLLIVGPPPVTRITDISTASQKFPYLGQAPDPDVWFKKDGGAFEERRRDIADALETAFIDDAGVDAYGIASHWTAGSNYPDQPDGLHLVDGADMVARAIIDATGVKDIVDSIKTRKAEKLSSENREIPFDYDRWASEISKIEGRYSSVNPDTVALGKYQFVPAYWWGKIREFAGNRISSPHEVVSHTKRGKPFYADYQDYLNDPQLQEDWMRHYTMSYVIPAAEALKNEFPDVDRSVGQLAALYHFQGLGGARSWLSRNEMQGADVNVINPNQYMDRVS